MLGTTTCNNSEVIFHGDRAVRPGVKFVLQKGTVNSLHTLAFFCISRWPLLLLLQARDKISSSKLPPSFLVNFCQFSISIDFFDLFSPLFTAFYTIGSCIFFIHKAITFIGNSWQTNRNFPQTKTSKLQSF